MAVHPFGSTRTKSPAATSADPSISRPEQQAEQEDVDWPETIGRFRLREQTASDTHAEYRTDYLSGYGILGTKRQERSEDIRFYDDTRKYHFMDESYARKKVAIEAAEEELTDLTETLILKDTSTRKYSVVPVRKRGGLGDRPRLTVPYRFSSFHF